MRQAFGLILLGLLWSSCGERQSVVFKAPLPDSNQPAPHEAVATFAEGCFWHTEIVFQSLKGVRDAVSGYAGGMDDHPDYESVSNGNTGHAEAVAVYYDSTKISFEQLVAAFFASHDPTQLGHQGPDVGPQYRSIAFYRNRQEKAAIETAIAEINASGRYTKKLVTEVLPLTKFYPAEAYHQEYIANHPNDIYVHNVSIPDYINFRKTFSGPFKDTLVKR